MARKYKGKLKWSTVKIYELNTKRRVTDMIKSKGMGECVHTHNIIKRIKTRMDSFV